MCKSNMAVKPLNLSIVVGDANKPPEIKTRGGDLLSLRSRIPLSTASNNLRVPARGSTTFRQWADPPPAPTRSRTAQRKNNHAPKRRPGSVDSRFRRTLDSSQKENPTGEKFKTFIEVKNEFLNSAKDFSHIKDFIELPKENSKLSPRSKDQTSQVNLEPLMEDKVNNVTVDKSVDTATFKDNEKLPQFQAEIREETAFEKFEKHRFSDPPVLRSNILDPRFLKDDGANSLTTNRYSQTEISFGEIENYSSSSSDLGKNDFEFQEREVSSVDVDRQQDSLILDRTRSLDDIGKQSSSVEKRSKRRRTSEIMEVKQYMNNNTPYIKYLEVWAAVLSIVLILVCTWYFLIPFIYALIKDTYNKYINPPPVYSPGGILVETVKNIVNGFRDVLTASSHKRLKWISFS